MREILTISKLNRYVKSLIQNDALLSEVEVRGEIINLKRYASAVYFTLKEGDQARISAVSFSLSAFPATLKDGDEVICRGAVSLYEKSGTYQLVCYDVNYYGLGAKLVELAKLKEKLEKTGIFSSEHKQKLPKFPKTIGIITPKDSAAQSDVITNITRRYPLVTLKIVNATFQGENAPASLISAFNKLNNPEIDVLIIARGGGSSDDLWAFNDEGLVLALAERKIPLISAIGHEIDTTLVDYIADVRASTPTAAAELSVPSRLDLTQDIINAEERIKQALNLKYRELHEKLNSLVTRPVLTNFSAITLNINERIANLKLRLSRATEGEVTLNITNINKQTQRLNEVMVKLHTKLNEQATYLSAKLETLSPTGILARGYAFISRDTEIITSAATLAKDDEVTITFNDGSQKAIIKGEEV